MSPRCTALVVVAAVLLAVMSCAVSARHHKCIHDQVKFKDIPTIPQSYEGIPSVGAATERTAQAQATATFANMRVKFLWNADGKGACNAVGDVVPSYRQDEQGNYPDATCTAADVLTDQKKAYFIKLLTDTAAMFSRTLQVNPIAGPLKPPATCGNHPGITTTGNVSDCDFVIYATAVPTPGKSTTLAWASSCSFDQSGRPVAGQINFVPSMYTIFPPPDYQYQLDLRTAIHELSHALGFSAPFFRYGVMKNQSNTGTISYFSKTLQKNVSKINSPSVLARARAYFNCSTLDGVEIEEGGGKGTAGSHWEQRILGEEYMAGVRSTLKIFVSSITLAYFQDTGLYKANFSAAEDAGMQWGRNTNCDITDNKCNSGLPGAKKTFCFSDPGQVCLQNRLAIGHCNLIKYSGALPANYQYFSDPMVGGLQSQDFCPTVTHYSNTICSDSTQNTLQKNTPLYGANFSASSLCLMSSLLQTAYVFSNQTAPHCFPVRCGTDGRLTIVVGGSNVLCPADGSATWLTVPGYNGKIECPTSMEMCGKTPKPTTAKPTTAKPTTAKPTTAKPTTAKPTTAKPTTAKPTTAKPTTAKPTTAKPTTAKPTTAKPTTAKPTTAKPTTAKPTTAKPTTAKPATTKPV